MKGILLIASWHRINRDLLGHLRPRAPQRAKRPGRQPPQTTDLRGHWPISSWPSWCHSVLLASKAAQGRIGPVAESAGA